MMLSKWKIFSAAAIAVALQVPAGAAPVAVGNNSFELPDVGGFQDNGGIVAGQPLPAMSNTWYYLGGFTAGGSPVGVEQTSGNGAQLGGDLTQNGYVNVGAALGSANLGPILANTTYTLTVGVTDRSNGFNSTSGAAIALASVPSGTPGDVALANPINWLASNAITLATLQAVPNTFNDYQASFSTGASGGAIGQQLVVVLMSQNNQGFNNPIGFDNVRVDAVPEPASCALLAIGGLFVRRRMRR